MYYYLCEEESGKSEADAQRENKADTEEIVGWSVGPTLEQAYPIEALKMALRRLEGKTGISLIHHSDRGCQYASREYVRILNEYGIRISMTETGNPKDNAQAVRQRQ